MYFAEKKPDFVILEVGLGGSGDSTNIIEKPLVSVITQIAMDHTDRLGDTIELIAAEKAGIIKRGCPVVTVADGEAAKVIARRAYELDAPFFSAVQSVKDAKVKGWIPGQARDDACGSQDDAVCAWDDANNTQNSPHTSFCAKSQNPHEVSMTQANQEVSSTQDNPEVASLRPEPAPGYDPGSRNLGFSTRIRGLYYSGIEISMLGRHQIENAICALTALEILREDGHIRMDSEALKAGMFAARMPGRFEIVDDNPIIVLDGAHNAAGAAALNTTVSETFHDKKVLALLGILVDKDAESVLKSVCEFADGLILTTAPTDRGMSAAELYGLAGAFNDTLSNDKIFIETVDAPSDALVKARQLADEDNYDVIVLCGSLYLIAELRELALKGLSFRT
jgi:dihydrofolate synthase/folylpolyglutamate synthase